MRLRVERRLDPSAWINAAVSVLSVLLAFGVGGVLLLSLIHI